MSLGAIDRRDERRHRPPPDRPGWAETFVYEALEPDGRGCSIRLTVHPFARRVWYSAIVVRPDGPLVAVVDTEIGLPGVDTSLEVRTDGLWADHNVETAFTHVSIGLEAFGLALDDPTELLGAGLGIRTPVGFDLEWESTAAPVPWDIGADPPPAEAPAIDTPPLTTDPSRSGYQLPARGHGEILLGPDVIELDGVGRWGHAWGELDWWITPWARLAAWWEDGTFDSIALDGHEVRALLGAEPRPPADSISTDGGTLGVAAVAWAPLPLRSVGAARSTLLTAAVRLVDPAGRAGVGWIEANEPGPAR